MRSYTHRFLLALVLLCMSWPGPLSAQNVEFSPNPLTFVPQAVGSPSSSFKHLVITNTGILPLVITSATITGDDFSFASGTTLNIGTINPGASFTTVLVFRASTAGLRNGSLTLQDNAPGSPHTLAISSQGFTGAGIQAPDQDDGILLATPTIGNGVSVTETLISSGTQSATVTGVNVTGAGFSQTNTCGASMNPGNTCDVQVTFNPTVAGTQNGTLAISNTGFVNPLVIPLSGSGADFSIVLAPGSVGTATVTAGQAATFQLHLVNPSGLPGATTGIAVTCSGLPPASTCNVTQTPDPQGFFTAVSIGIVTTGRGNAESVPLVPRALWPLVAAILGIVGFAGVDRSRRAALPGLVLLTVCLGFLISCGGSNSSSSSGGTVTPAGSYNATITATRGNLTHTFNLTLNVK